MTNQQQFILDSFSSMTLVPDKMDVQDEPLYDSWTVAAGSSLTNNGSYWFSNVGASASPAKTISQTNMLFANRLPAPEAFSIFGFALRYQENISLLDLYNLIQTFAFEFWMNQKRYNVGPIWYYPAGGGIFGTNNQAFSNTAGTVFNNGVPGRRDMHQLGVNIVIENQSSFYADLAGNTYTVNASGNGITMQCALRGLHARGVN